MNDFVSGVVSGYSMDKDIFVLTIVGTPIRWQDNLAVNNVVKEYSHEGNIVRVRAILRLTL